MKYQLNRRVLPLILTAWCVWFPIFGRAQILFDNTKSEVVANADWIIDVNQPIPSPSITNINSGTAETYWNGALSSWGVALAKLRNSGAISLAGNGLETLPTSGRITYGDGSNSQDLSHYQVYVVCEPNILFTATEKTAILNFVQNGGGLFMVADHNGSDRNNDGYDSLHVWNDLFTNNTVKANPFGFTFNADDVTPASPGVDATAGDPIVHGIAGTVTTIKYDDGCTMNITDSTVAHAAVWESNPSQVMVMYGSFGSGRFVAIGDSSVTEDATSSSGTTYAGWTTPVDNGYAAINGTVWLLNTNGSSASSPAVSTGSATAIGTNSATLNATVNPNGQAASAYFLYGTTTNYGFSTNVAGSLGGSNSQPVSATLSNLPAATLYHFTIVASNASGVSTGLDQTFTTAQIPLAPTVSTLAATSVTTNGATLNGTVNPNGQNTSALFLYGLGTNYSFSTNLNGTLTGTNAQAVSAAITGLAPGTTYHFACAATNATGYSTGADQIFITGTIVAGPPIVVTGAASLITSNTATLNGTVNADGQTTAVQFQYGLTTNYTSVTNLPGQLAGTNAQAVGANLAGLTPGTVYHFAVAATNASGSTNGLDQTFTTSVVVVGPPVVSTGGATSVTTTGATLNGTVNPGNQNTSVQFRYGQTTNYTSITNLGGVLSGTNAQAVNVSITGLSPGTTWHFAVAASNASGSVTGLDQSFTTISTNSGASNYAGILAGWDVNGVTAFGSSPFAPTTNAPNLGIVGLTRGSGLTTTPTAASRAWGANGWSQSTSAAGISGNEFVTFSMTPSNGCTLNISNISRFDYRRSSTGPTNGLLQYSIGGGAFTNITTFSYSSSSSSGASLGAFDLSSIPALQNVASGTTVAFRLVNYAATGSGGTWYIFDVADSTALDFSLSGSLVAPAVSLTPIQAWRQQWFGTISNSGNAADTFIGSSDGMPNLLKYALGLNPLVASTNPVTGGTKTGVLAITVPRNANATDITYYLESAPLTTGPWTSNSVAIDTNTPALLEGHDTNNIAATAGRFIRFRVTDP